MNFVNEFGEKRNGFAEVVAFCHVTCRYFDRFLLQGVDKNWRQACLFYLAPGLICEGYWQVNSRRSIFRIADPTPGAKCSHACWRWASSSDVLISNYHTCLVTKSSVPKTISLTDLPVLLARYRILLITRILSDNLWLFGFCQCRGHAEVNACL